MIGNIPSDPKYGRRSVAHCLNAESLPVACSDLACGVPHGAISGVREVRDDGSSACTKHVAGVLRGCRAPTRQ